jgi:hypothetical protein
MSPSRLLLVVALVLLCAGGGRCGVGLHVDARQSGTP